MPPVVTETHAGRSAFRGFVHLHCLRRTRKTADLLAAAHAAASPPAIHDLRVAARRLIYTLDCFATVLPPDGAADFRKRIKSILSATHPVREIDVALELVPAVRADAADTPTTALRLRRGLAEKTLRKRLQHLTQRWLSTASEIAPALQGGGTASAAAAGKASASLPWRPDESCASNAGQVLPLLAMQYFGQGRGACSTGSGAEALHEFRLQGKRLRYCLEMFGDQYGPSLGARVATLRDVQRRLGIVSDCDTVARLLRSAVMPTDAALGRALAALRERQQDATESFLAHWQSRLAPLEVEREWRSYLAMGSEEASASPISSGQSG